MSETTTKTETMTATQRLAAIRQKQAEKVKEALPPFTLRQSDIDNNPDLLVRARIEARQQGRELKIIAD